MTPSQIYRRKKAREKRDLKRKAKARATRKRVLIVTEGEQTEVNYLNAIKQRLRPECSIEIKAPGYDPLGMVEYAIQIFKDDPDFDAIFCVFDRDDHTRFDAAMEKIRDTPPLAFKIEKKQLGKARIHAIPSHPCFEIWLLLHFTYTTRPFTCYEELKSELRKFLDSYDKKASFDWLTMESLNTACKNARMAAQAAQSANTRTPNEMHQLIH